jgi:TolB-like protein
MKKLTAITMAAATLSFANMMPMQMQGQPMMPAQQMMQQSPMMMAQNGQPMMPAPQMMQQQRPQQQQMMMPPAPNQAMANPYANQSNTRMVPTAKPQPQAQMPQLLLPAQDKNIPLYITHSTSSIGNLNAMIIFLADQLERNIDSKYFSQPSIVATFSNLDNLKSTSSFGRLIAENLAHELQVRKWRVIEVKMAKSITMTPSGEFAMTREVAKIKGAHKVRAIVTGTYTYTDENVIVNAKVLNLDTGILLSSAQIIIPTDSISSIMYDDVNPRLMRIKSE